MTDKKKEIASKPSRLYPTTYNHYLAVAKKRRTSIAEEIERTRLKKDL